MKGALPSSRDGATGGRARHAGKEEPRITVPDETVPARRAAIDSRMDPREMADLQHLTVRVRFLQHLRDRVPQGAPPFSPSLRERELPASSALRRKPQMLCASFEGVSAQTSAT